MYIFCVLLCSADLASVLEVQGNGAAGERDKQELLQTNLPDVRGKLIVNFIFVLLKTQLFIYE